MSNLPKLIVSRQNLFAGGQAPACWQRDFSRIVRKQDGLNRACSWVAAAVKSRPLRLQTQPLWGNCLAELVNVPFREPIEAQQDEPTRRKTRTQTPNFARKPVIVPAAEHKPSKQAQELTEVLANPPKVKRDFLQQLAKAAVQTQSTRNRSARKTSSAKRLLDTSAAKLDSTTAVSIPNPADKKSTQAWRKSITRKAGQRLTQPDMFNKPGKSSVPDRNAAAFSTSKITKLTQGDKQLSAMTASEFVSAAEQGKRPLSDISEEAWQQPIKGQSVSTNLLKSLTTRGVDNETRREAPQQTRPANRLFAEEQQLPSSGQIIQTEPEKRPPTLPDIESQHSPTLGHTPAFAAWDALKNRSDPRSNEPHVAPPQMATTLPPLRGQQRPSTPEPPLATAVTRQSAHREAAAIPEDLDMLAAKIKQILDEESRRFGIDV